eukprot:GHVS01038488.1.p1 GENE.GHVS01038488.1~~GHVS01038488.1.p1  ORF type:complete len:313 (+),score=62.45 GHVS01038488.1:569-1507(+)
MSAKFPNDDLLVIRPSTITTDGFSLFNNFIYGALDSTGQPRDWKHVSTVPEVNPLGESKCVLHLSNLLTSLYLTETAVPNNLVLVGFSKGGVVLSSLLKTCSVLDHHQQQAGDLLRQNGSSSADANRNVSTCLCSSVYRQLTTFWGRVRRIHFLDASLNEPGLLFSVSTEQAMSIGRQTNLKVDLHYTPRQLLSPQRWYLRADLQEFMKLLRSAGVSAELREYYRDVVERQLNSGEGGGGTEGLLSLLTMNMHFSVIWDFDCEGRCEDGGGGGHGGRIDGEEGGGVVQPAGLYFDIWQDISKHNEVETIKAS